MCNSFRRPRSVHLKFWSITVKGSSKRIAGTSRLTKPRPRLTSCCKSDRSLSGRVSRYFVISNNSATSSTRFALTSLLTPRFFSGNARFSRTVIVSYKTGNWKTWATLRFAVSRSVTSTPSKYTRPTDGVSKPEIILSRVVLPQPLGPRSAIASPSFQVNEIGLRAKVAPSS